MTPDFSIVTEFENKIAEFFGATYAVAVDSCTSGVELCLRYQKAKWLNCPKRTYLSIPMLANKLNIRIEWMDWEWKDCYSVYDTPEYGTNIIDAAVLWRKDSYRKGTFMNISFQYQKHLSLGRGGMILCPDKESAELLKKMSYDGRIPGIPWREQNVDTMGYHYYMTPETAALGLQKLPDAILTIPKQWDYSMYPDLTKMDVFKNTI